MFQSKLPNLKPTIFTVMSKMAQETNAINLSQGFPDFHPPQFLLDLVKKNLDSEFNQYAPSLGAYPLRAALANMIENKYGRPVEVDSQVIITSGASEALFTALATIINHGDEVIIFEPAYDLYTPVVELFGGRTIPIQLEGEDFRVPWDKVKSKVNDRTKSIIINSPHNPTGSLLSDDDMRQLENIVVQNSIVVVSDEVYEHLTFDNIEHQSVHRFEKLRQQSFVIGSFGKTFHVTGWKIGYCVGPAEFMLEFQKIHQYNTFTSNHPVQLALAEALKNVDFIDEVKKDYQDRRDFFLDLMESTPFRPARTLGTYFQLMDYRGISDESDIDFSKRLTFEAGVATIPVSVFYKGQYNGKYLRFCFAKEKKTLADAAAKIKSFLS